MRSLRCRLTFAVIIPTLIIFLSGCAIGIKSRSNDAPPEDDVYYEESSYGSYSGAGFRSSGYSRYNSGYDPWTMGTYYQHYSGPSRSGASSGNPGTSSVKSESNKPTVRDRNSTSVSQPKAPAESNSSNLKRGRSSVHDRRNTSSQIRDSSRRKVRRDTSNRVSQESKSAKITRTKQRRTATQSTSQKSRPKQAESTTEKEDEKNKKKRPSG